MVRDDRQKFVASALSARRRFLEMLEGPNAQQTQALVLEQCITRNASTAFANDHGFASIRDIDAYRKAVPIRHYDELEPWIERAASGEPKVLTKEDPVRFWKTTGTTSKSKKIPVTPSALARGSESFLVLTGTQLHHHPELSLRPDAILACHLSPKTIKEYLGNGRFPYCSTTEIPIEVKPGKEGFFPPWLMPLQEVSEDDSERLYFLLCFAALHELQAITCLHPSRLQTVVSVLAESSGRIIEELRNGTVLGKRMREPRPHRAKELEAILSKSGSLRPCDIWPSLRLTSAWSGSYISRYMSVIEGGYGADFLAMPSISSECFMTMTVDRDRTGQPLNMRGAVFEFAPSNEPVRPDTRTFLFDELEQGATYEIILTTFGGLYRYAMCDIFRVIGKVGSVPRLEYLGRRAVCDLTGEKLAEEQVADSVGALLAELGIEGTIFTVCGIQDPGSGRRPHYVIVLEGKEDAVPALLARGGDISRSLDARFRAVNSRYELKRNFKDLEEVVVEIVEPGTFRRYRELLASRGMPAGQIKDKILHPAGATVLTDLLACGGRPRA